ncbi:nucleoside 2-deoxyribosyltransferase [Spiroplasma endosymbiont of Clivina fossor]|uniref:nucleoside 2-deoxyribosyltransferase n=1 Tax=Spiroplasma endosymbiont of Clivina fossor TaxID=3066282 RepID=UPI00313E1221
MKKIFVYNAGPLFSEAEQNQRRAEGINLRKQLGSNFEILNPIEFSFNSENATPKNNEIFKKDYEEIKRSKYVIFDIDGRDSGTYMEYGFAFEQCLHEEKYLICVYSDFRLYQSNIDVAEIPGYGINEMISGSLQYNDISKKKIFKVKNFQEAINKIKEIEGILK